MNAGRRGGHRSISACQEAGTGDNTMRSQKQIAVFGSFLTDVHCVEFKMAEDLGCLLARNGFKVICGGHGGIANSLVAGVTRGGGEVLGVSLAKSRYPERSAKTNPLITERFAINSPAERLEFFANSDAFIFFTGGIGTLTEFSFVWHSLQLSADFDRPIVLVSKSWKRILASIRNEQMVKHKYYRMLHLCDRIKDAVAVVADDYALKYDEPGGSLRKRSVLFHLDGTVVESREEEFSRLCEDAGYFFPLPDVVAAFRETTPFETKPAHFAAILQRLGVAAGTAAAIAGHLCCQITKIPELYPDALEALHHLKESGFSTGVVSWRHPSQVKEILSAHNLSALFDFAGTPDNAAGRSGASVAGGALEVSGFSREGTVYIADGFQGDCPPACTGGIDTILLDRYLTHIQGEDGFKLRSLKELKSLVKYDAAAGEGKADPAGY